jgi:hypothetical protein
VLNIEHAVRDDSVDSLLVCTYNASNDVRVYGHKVPLDDANVFKIVHTVHH